MKYRFALQGALFACAILAPAWSQEAVVVDSGGDGKKAKERYYIPLSEIYDPQKDGAEKPEERDIKLSEVGLKYRIQLLDRKDDFKEVTDRHKFRTDDRVRFVFESNIDGYLYIFHKGASGKGSQLFPDPRLNGGKNFIKKYHAVTVPARTEDGATWWTFDETVGEENLYVFLSADPIADLAALVPTDHSYIDEDGWQVINRAEAGDSKVEKPHVYYGNAAVLDLDIEVDQSEDEMDDASVAYVVAESPILVHHITLKHAR